MIVLGFDPYADPIPAFNEGSLRCWLGPSGIACDAEGRWSGRPGDDDHPMKIRCTVVHNRKHHCTLDLDDPPPVVQERLFGGAV